MSAAKMYRTGDADALLIRAAKRVFDSDPASVNDTMGHAAVMQMYDKAIELAALVSEKEGQERTQ
jgi:hypothetical protein